MRKFLIVLASAATLVITGAATKAAYFSGHAVQAKSAVTTLDPLSMHYRNMPVQEFSDRTFVFDN
jgi:hypothetical protein